MENTTNQECPQGDCSREGEYITHRTDLNNNDPDQNLATMCDCGRVFNSRRGMRIHRARWCKQRNPPNEGHKSNNGNMNQDNTHSIQDPIADQQQPGDIPSRPRIQWPKGNQRAIWSNLDQELTLILTNHLKGSVSQQLKSFCGVVYETCLEKFGEMSARRDDTIEKRPNRRQIQKGRLRAEQRMLKRRLKESPPQEQLGIENLLEDLKKRILIISRAENARKRRKKKQQSRKSFYNNPYAFAKKLFTDKKSGKLDVPQEELESHLKRTYSDELRHVPIPPINDLPILHEPEITFKTGNLKLREVQDFVRKARAGSAPGINGISYKLYKNCPGVLRELTTLLQNAWKHDLIPQDWCVANGIWIPKETNAKGIENFRPISLLNVEGKIFFGVIAKRMTDFLIGNRYIDTSVQKAGIPGFPGCLEHSQMIWNSISLAKRNKTEMHVIWLDLANAYGSVPHELIRIALDYFNFPDKIKNIVMMYFGSAYMQFTVKGYTTKWQALEIGIMMGCVISPLLFVMAMELILRGAKDICKGEITKEQLVLPPSRAYMDDITILVQSKIGADNLLRRYFSLFTWARMRVKPQKSRSLSLIKGSVRKVKFRIGGDLIPTIKEKPVKSLGRLYEVPLTDRHRGTELQKIAVKGLKSIHKTYLPGKMKVWCYQHGLLPRLLWPLQVYEIALSRVNRIQQLISKYLRIWLGVPPCFSTIGLYTNSGLLQLPLTSLVEEFKVGKARLHMMMRDSPDEIVRSVHPEIKSGSKWSAAETTQEAESSLRTKDIMGVTQTSRAGLGSMTPHFFSEAGPKGKRDMVITEIRNFEDEKRMAAAVAQAKQCAWTTWTDVEPIHLSWNAFMAMDSLAISFLLRSTYDLLPNATNLKLWGYTDTDVCKSCNGTRGTLHHVLSGCPKSLPMYTWRHNEALKVVAELIVKRCEAVNQQPLTAQENNIRFHKEGEIPRAKSRKVKTSKLLNGARDWLVASDITTRLKFPAHIAQTNQRPDIVIWSNCKKHVLLVELTVPWEENIEAVYEAKKDRYETLRSDCEDGGWTCNVLPIEIGCRGFMARSTISLLTKIGMHGAELKNALRRLSSTVQSASAWIWTKSKNNRTTSS